MTVNAVCMAHDIMEMITGKLQTAKQYLKSFILHILIVDALYLLHIHVLTFQSYCQQAPQSSASQGILVTTCNLFSRTPQSLKSRSASIFNLHESAVDDILPSR